MDDSGYWKTIALELKAKVEEMTQENARLTADVEEYAKQWRDIGLKLQTAKRDRDAAIAARDEMERSLAIARSVLREIQRMTAFVTDVGFDGVKKIRNIVNDALALSRDGKEGENG